MYYTSIESKLIVLLGNIYMVLFIQFGISVGSLGENYLNVESISTELPSLTTSAPDRKHQCGRLQISRVNHSFEFDVYDREEVNSCLTEIHDSETHEDFEYLYVEDGCEMKLCVLEFLQPDNPTRKRVCYRFTNDSPLKTNGNEYLKYFYVVVVSCSCKQPTKTCKVVNCKNISLEENECARLYKEPYCQECRYEHNSLTTVSNFIPSNSFSVDSFIVKDGCNLDIKSVGDINIPEKPPEYSYNGIHELSQLSYVQKPNKSIFSCSCGNNGNILDNGDSPADLISESENENGVCNLRQLDEVDPKTERISTKKDSSSAHIIIAFTVPLAVVIIIAFAYCKTLVNVKTLKGQLEAEAIARFQVGESNLVVNLHQENPNYVSFGYAQALKLPYQKKYEIPRNLLLLDEQQELGVGAFGKVLLGKLIISKSNECSATEKLVAVKMTKSNTSLEYFISLLDEIKILAYIGSHPNVVRLIGACTENIKQREDALIVMELCKNGSLSSYLKKNRKMFINSHNSQSESEQDESIAINSAGYAVIPTISETVSYVKIKPEFFWYFNKWAKEIANGMEYLSSMQVVHIDLAARNILLTEDLVAKIGDFGLSKRMQDVINYVRLGSECRLPFRYMAPESLIECRFSTQSDVWSYGVTLWEIYSLCDNPYENIPNYSELLTFLRDNQRLSKPIHASSEIYNEMLRCWECDPMNRPSFSELKTFFKSLLDPDSEENTRF